jgi:hypothetical protein
MISVETIPEIGGGVVVKGGMVEEINSSMIYLIYVRTFVSATINPHSAQQ